MAWIYADDFDDYHYVFTSADSTDGDYMLEYKKPTSVPRF